MSMVLFYKFLLSLGLGALIGIEREKRKLIHQGRDFAGIRTFMLFTFFGTSSAYIAQELQNQWIIVVMYSSFVLMALAAYILNSYLNKETGMTTEISAIMAFIIGIIVMIEPNQEVPIALAIVVTLLLSFKQVIHRFANNLKSEEFIDTIKFLLIAFVVLPLLRGIAPFGPYEAINLYEIWLMVVFVSGLSYVGYISMRILGSNRGTLITGLLGGLLSSTAMVTSLANKSKHNNHPSFAVAAAIACSTMFLRMIIEIGILNFDLVESLLFPLILLALVGYISIVIVWNKKEDKTPFVEMGSPLMLTPALKFGFFYGFIILISAGLHDWLGPKGLLVAALVSGIADVDAITIFIARSSTDMALGGQAIILAAIVNTGVKLVYAKLFGSKEYAATLAKILSVVIFIGTSILIFM